MTDDKELVLNPRTRVRVETMRGFLLGLKALIENGCEIKSVHLRAMAAAGKARQQSIGRRRKAGEDNAQRRVVGKKKGKAGRPRVHRKKRGETDQEYQRRLGRVRAENYRARKKEKVKP